MTDPDPGRPLTDDEAHSWVAAVDGICGVYLGDMNLAEVEQVVASMLAANPGNEWAPRVADALRARWRTQRAARLTDAWEQIKRTT